MQNIYYENLEELDKLEKKYTRLFIKAAESKINFFSKL